MYDAFHNSEEGPLEVTREMREDFTGMDFSKWDPQLEKKEEKPEAPPAPQKSQATPTPPAPPMPVEAPVAPIPKKEPTPTPKP